MTESSTLATPASDPLIATIIALEWAMFSHVQNAGGRASCQEDPHTFQIMRASQCATWPETMRQSYLSDLQAAQADGRNVLTEKYARMMAATHPAGYAQFKDQLPPIAAETLAQIDEIVAINLRWEAEVDQQYPHVRAKGRPLTNAQDSPCTTSFETYLRGELQTYSSATIALYYDHTLACAQANHNLAADNLTHMVKAYGYDSLTHANQRMGDTNTRHAPRP